MAHSRSVGTRFRSLIAVTLQAYGLPATTRRQATPGTAEGHASTDLEGISGWALNTRAERSPRLSAGLDEARQDAERAGVPFYAVVWPRDGREVDSSFVVTDLRTFAKVAALTSVAETS